MYKNILLDLDGTVVNTEEGVVKSIAYALEAYGYEVPGIEKLRTYIGPPLTKSFQDDYGVSEEKSLEMIYKFRERYMHKCAIESELFPYMAEGIKELKDNGFLIALCSSKNEPACKQILEYHNILEYFDSVVGASEDTSREKKIEIIEEFFKRFPEATKEETVLIGDTIYDVVGAKEYGIDCIGVEYGFGDTKAMLDNGALAIFNDFKEVCDYVRKL